MKNGNVKAGDVVIFTGKEYRVARIYKYDTVFGTKQWTIKELRRDCCNIYLIFEEIEGAYNSKMFTNVTMNDLNI